MTTPFQQSGRKVLKKCKEWGIYPSFYHDNRKYSDYAVFRCSKCLKSSNNAEDNMYKAQEEWNKANGFDENDATTWHDEIRNESVNQRNCQHILAPKDSNSFPDQPVGAICIICKFDPNSLGRGE